MGMEEMNPKTILAVAAIISAVGGGGIGTLAGGARAEEKLAEQDVRLSVIEEKVDAVKDQVQANALEVLRARKANEDTVERIHNIENDTTKILTILEEREDH